MTDETAMGKTGGASGVDEKAVEEALKTIRFTDIPDERKGFPEKQPAPATPQSPKMTLPATPVQQTVPGIVIPPKPIVSAAAPAQTSPTPSVPQRTAQTTAAPLPPKPEIPFRPPASPTPPAPPRNTPPAGTDAKQDFARIVEEIKLPERRSFTDTGKTPTLQTSASLVRAQLPPTSAPIRAARIITPEGVSEPVLAKVPFAPAKPAPPLEKNIIGEAVPPPKQPPQTAEAAVTQPAVPAMDKRPIVPSLHTLKDDLYDLVRVRKMSLIHAATLESERKKHSAEAGSATQATKTKRRVRLFRLFLTMGIFLALGGAALFTVFIVQVERTTTTPTNFGTALVFAEQTLGFPLSTTLSPREIRQQLASSRYQGNLTLGAVLRIVPTIQSAAEERPASAIDFMKALAEGVPEELLRVLDRDFFFGVHTVDENVPFIILPITSYENAFAAMLSWEPLMNEELYPLFPRVHYTKTDEKGVPMLVRFADVVIKNYDVRALRDEEGEVRMLYSFPSRDILIIAESPHSFVEALARLRAERRL